MSFEDEDGKKPNPLFNKNRDGGYENNCQSCVVAYEARRRGFDVEAKPFNKLGVAGQVARDTRKVWNKKGGDVLPEFELIKIPKTSQELESTLENIVDSNARYHFGFDWKNGGAHIVTSERTGGVLCLYDPQSSKLFKNSSLRNYLSAIELPKTNKNGKVTGRFIELLRVENLAINYDTAGEILKDSV